MYYKNIAEQVKAEYAGYMESHAAAIMEGSADRVKRYSTDTRARQYDAGKISLDELKRIAVERNTRKYNKEMQLERMKYYGYSKRDAVRLYREKYNLKYKKLVKVEY